MSLAPAAYLLFQRLLRHDPTDPSWIGRDRFVLSCGHSSLTLYIQLFLRSDEPGTGGVPALPAAAPPRPHRPVVDRPRPLRPVLRPLQPDSLYTAVPPIG